MFRKIKSMKMPYMKQGYIYFACKNYVDLPRHVRKRIRCICTEVGGEDSKALLEFLTTDRTASGVSMRYYMRENNLYEMRREFYKRFNDEILKDKEMSLF